jgi:hypothetical protein
MFLSKGDEKSVTRRVMSIMEADGYEHSAMQGLQKYIYRH